MKVTYRHMISVDVAVRYCLVAEDGRLGIFRYRINLCWKMNSSKLMEEMRAYAEANLGCEVELVEGPVWENIADLDGLIPHPATGEKVTVNSLSLAFHNLPQDPMQLLREC